MFSCFAFIQDDPGISRSATLPPFVCQSECSSSDEFSFQILFSNFSSPMLTGRSSGLTLFSFCPNQCLYLWDLNEKKYLRVSNESIHENYDYRRQCVYCVYDTRRRNGEDDIVPRCDTDVSTRSRFFKHLQSLEKSLNRRLICFEEELPVFRLQDLLDKERPTDRKSGSVDGSELTSANSSIILPTSDPMDIFLQLLTNKNQSDNLLVKQTVDQPKEDQTGESEDSQSDNRCDSPQPDHSTTGMNGEPSEHFSSDETSSISSQTNSLESLCLSSKSGRPPIVKSIKQIEKELSNRKIKKLKTDHGSDIFDYIVRVNQITDQNEIKFLCYLNEL